MALGAMADLLDQSTSCALAGPTLPGAAAAGDLHRSYRELRQIDHQGANRSCSPQPVQGQKTPGNNNLPADIAQAILRVKPTDKFCVLEVAAAIRGERIPLERPLSLVKPRIGVVTNIGSDHISAFGSVEAIAGEKSKLIAALPSHGIAILNADDPNVMAMRALYAGRTISYGLGPRRWSCGEYERRLAGERLSFTVWFDGRSSGRSHTVAGSHLVHCAPCRGFTIGLAMGCPLQKAAEANSERAPFQGRMSPVIRGDE